MLEKLGSSLAATAALVRKLERQAGEDQIEKERLKRLYVSLVSHISAYQNDLAREIEAFCDSPKEGSWGGLTEHVAALAANVRRIIKDLEEQEGDFVVAEGATYRELVIGMGDRRRMLDEVAGLGYPPSPSDINRLRTIASDYRTLVSDLKQSQDELAAWVREPECKRSPMPETARPVRTDVAILVHGIRDFGLWQDTVRTALEEAGFTVETTNYGRFNLIRFLLPMQWQRKYAIRAVAHQLRIVSHLHPGKRVSVIAHSFGTYVIACLLRDNFEIRFHRIIFCGSVLPFDFPFEKVLDKFERPLLNEVGTADIWPAIAESVTVGYGSAGSYGFNRPLVHDRRHNGAAHGYFLEREFATKFWVPFLDRGAIIAPGSDPPAKAAVWVRLLTVVKIKYVLALVAVCWGVAEAIYRGALVGA